MILRSLELKNFGRFSDKSYELRRGMNLVIGPNEAGKSTMMASVPAVLFGVRDKKRYLPWGRSQGCDAALLFEGQQGNIRIERDMVSDRVELIQSDDMYQELFRFSGIVNRDLSTADAQNYSQHLRQWLGLNDEALFRASLFVGQGDFPTDTEEFERYVRTLLSGFTQCDSEMVLRSLHDDYAAITCDDPWQQADVSPRELEAVQESLLELEQKQLQSQTLMVQLEQVRQQITQLKQELDADRQEYDKGVEYLEWIQQQWLQQHSEGTEGGDPPPSDTLLLQECQQLEQQLEQAGVPSRIPEALPRLLAEADDVRHSMIGLQSEMIPLRDRLQKIGLPDWKRPGLLTLLVTAVSGGAQIAWPAQLVPVVGAGAVIVAGGWIAYGLSYRKKMQQQQQLKQQMDEIEQRREKDQQRLVALDDEFEQLEISSSAVELVRLQKMLDSHQDTLVRLNELRQQLATAEEGTTQNIISDAQATGAVLDSKHLKPDELPEAQQRLDDMMASLRQRETELLALVRQEALLLGRLADEKDEGKIRRQLEQRASELEQHKQVLHCAIDVLRDSLDEFRQSSLQRFEQEIALYLRKATLGRYIGVKIEEDFQVQLKSKNGQWVALAQLSRGTIDAACLAIRLGLSRFLSPGDHLPFFLDDALVNLDPDRLQETVSALERLSADHQIIMFSHDERLHKIAGRRRWHVISLGAQRNRLTTTSKGGADHGGQLSFL